MVSSSSFFLFSFYDRGWGFHGDCAGYDELNFAYIIRIQYFECAF